MFKIWLISLVCAGCAMAQSEMGPAGKVAAQMAGPAGITTALAGPMPNVTGAPYSAETVTERDQQLADGNRIVQSHSGSVARDSHGRTRREETMPGLKGSAGEATQLVMIDDPVAHVHWTLNSQNKTATKMPIPNLPAGAPGPDVPMPMSTGNVLYFTAGSGPGTSVSLFSSTMRVKDANGGSDPNVVKTDLGTQTIEGVPAQGTKITRTFPAGSELGNEQPLTITTETWFSPDLKVVVSSKSSDPRMGETSYRLTNIQRSEPAASLFQVPDDYTVQDAPALTLKLQQQIH